MKRYLFVSIIVLISVTFLLVAIEFVLRSKGYGTPPLYVYDPVMGYRLRSNQDITRFEGCRVFINSLGMRSPETSSTKSPEVFRVLVLGDSVPYAGSYIDQDETFCMVAQKELTEKRQKCEILNAGVNAYGPQNVLRYVESKGLFDADLVIVYFPWGDLRRDFTNFYIVPFWSNSSGYALEEFFRHGVWACFGRLSSAWKATAAFQDDRTLDMNISALERIQEICRDRGVPVYFFWSPYLSVILGKLADPYVDDKNLALNRLPIEKTILVENLFRDRDDLTTLYVDDCHYSKKGHRVVGYFLAEFINNFKKSRIMN